ncbi:MAG: 2-amino-4-hydroxy-6-hydroxymethyldihydropteridine diphosphokinase, partial [Phycisphaerales bacterium]|nr:2-amino-4-hydroxy-6-hydroxymethyldihydropteridine diphosphokinase [Phycisphaerales bacterium]
SPHGAPRPIDLDLLLVRDVAINTPELTLPHPRMHERAFVLVPLADVAPGLHVPGTGGPGQPPLTVAQLLARLGPLGAGAVRRIDP